MSSSRLSEQLLSELMTKMSSLSSILVSNYLADKDSPHFDPELEEEWLQDDAKKAIRDSHHEIVEIILQNFNKNVQSTSVAFHKACAKQAMEDEAFNQAMAIMETNEYWIEQYDKQNERLIAEFEREEELYRSK